MSSWNRWRGVPIPGNLRIDWWVLTGPRSVCIELYALASASEFAHQGYSYRSLLRSTNELCHFETSGAVLGACLTWDMDRVRSGKFFSKSAVRCHFAIPKRYVFDRIEASEESERMMRETASAGQSSLDEVAFSWANSTSRLRFYHCCIRQGRS